MFLTAYQYGKMGTDSSGVSRKRLVRTSLAGLIAALLIVRPGMAEADVIPTVLFNTTTPTNDLQGTLAARVWFAQSQILPAHLQEDDNQPSLTAGRKALLMVQPLDEQQGAPLRVKVLAGDKRERGSFELAPPELLPKTAYYLDGVPAEGIDFTPMTGTTGTVKGNSDSDMARLNDPAGTFLLEQLAPHAVLEISTGNGRWTGNIYLPKADELEGKIVRLTSGAYYNSTIHYSGRDVVLHTGEVMQFKFSNGKWWREGESLANNGIAYAANTWSVELPAEWIEPGFSLHISRGTQSGELNDLRVGPPTELLINAIDIGMLTPPRDAFIFAKEPETNREYFQTVPTSRLVVSQYAPLYLREVMLPDGTLLTDYDPSEGGWQSGTMRQRLAKELISQGINLANYGIHDTAGDDGVSYPMVVAQFTAHNSIGKYANGIKVHGGAGGAGFVSLDASTGNEFSHEVGHNFGLGHYVGGFQGSVHRAADAVNSTWGWDADRQRFIPNFGPSRTDKSSCLNDQCQLPFDGRPYGYDAMAGGAPLSSFNRYTLYTPNSAAIIQRFLESKAVFAAESPTGFLKWDPASQRMVPYSHRVAQPDQVTASNGDLSEATLAALLDEYKAVKVAMWDGNWTANINMPLADSRNQGRLLTIDHQATYNSVLNINGERIGVKRGFHKSYRSDGKQWSEVPIADSIERRPLAFGVPVTTLIGYYDPQAQLSTYIYPALHGAYGFGYGDDDASLGENDCQLKVETREGVLRFALSNHRQHGNVMNKFHVNVPEASSPSRATVVCRGQQLAEAQITPAPAGLGYTVNGRPLTTADPNQPPTLSVPEALSVEAGNWITLQAQGEDPDGDNLSYQWSVPEGWQAEGQDSAALTVLAPAVSEMESYQLTVSVSDGRHSTERNVQLTIRPAMGGQCEQTDPEASHYPAWQADKIYQGQEKVSHQQLVWQAKWWSQGNEPRLSAEEWALVSRVQLGWDASAAYSGGEQTVHRGRLWKAQWWTRGNEPGKAAVWIDQGPATCP